MSLLYLDLVGGISGDMAVAALLELGVPLDALREALNQAGLHEVALSTEPAQRHHLAGTRFIVRDVHGAPPDLGTGGGQGHHHEHGHGHSDEHGHHHEHGHQHSHAHGHSHGHSHRAYRDIRAMLAGSSLPTGVRERSEAVFARLAEAEGAVHGTPADDVTFHEVGAWDSIADVVCTAAALEHLGPERVLCSAVPVGSGMVDTAHGRMPIPTPATLLLLRGFPIVQSGPAYERTTPTGAAILAALAQPAPEPFAFVPERVGVGIGSKDPPEVPNLLRAVLGRERSSPSGSAGTAEDATVETIECAEANLDDTNPEWIGYLMERLLAAGALDVALLPIHMKKNRPGTQIQVLYRPALREQVHGLLFSEVTTLGVRYRPLERVALTRKTVRVATPWGEVGGVVARHAGSAHFSPEFEDCRRVAERAGVPLRAVYLAAQRAWQPGEA